MRTIRQMATGMVLMAMALPLFAESVGAPPLPPVETVLKRLVEQAEKESEDSRAFQQRYSYTLTKVTEYRNSEGDLKKREEKTSVNDPLAASVAPAPSPTTARTRSPKDADRNGVVTDTHSNVRGKAFERKDFSFNEELLGRFVFTLAGRELVNGRSALVLDFKPANRKLPERNLKERFINKAAGRIWADEADYTPARVDLYLTEKVNVLGGLVGAIWVFNYKFGRERTDDGLWFTRTVDWHLEGREVFLRRTVDYHEEKTDVREARPPGPTHPRGT